MFKISINSYYFIIIFRVRDYQINFKFFGNWNNLESKVIRDEAVYNDTCFLRILKQSSYFNNLRKIVIIEYRGKRRKKLYRNNQFS